MRIRQVLVGATTSGGLIFLLNACPSPTASNPPPPPPVTLTCPTTITAGVGGNLYAPSTCKVTLGGSPKTVVIQASVAHPLVTGTGPWPSAIAGAPTDQTITLTAAGTYTYQCQNHGGFGMTGSITAEN